MAAFRRHLASLGLALVVWQLTGVLAAPLAIHCRARAEQAARLPECCRLHGPGASCPMDEARAAKSANDCRLTATTCQDDASMVSLFGVTGVLAEPPCTVTPVAVSIAPRVADGVAAGRGRQPHPPPPRS